MNTIRTGSTEPIQIYATLASGNPATGLTDLYVRVRRYSDGFYLDWNDMTFKSAGWTTLNKILTELDATNAAGLYAVTGGLNTGAITNPATDDTYSIIPLQTPGTTARLPVPGELRIGRWVDQMNSMFGKLPTNYIMGSSTQADKDDEIDAILTDTSDMQPRVVAIEIDTDEMQGKLPTNNIMGSSVKTDKDDEIDAILTDTADMQPRVVAIEADTNEMQGKLPDNYIMGSGVTTDKDDEIDAIKTNTETIITDVGNVVNDVWDEQASLHTIGGSMGFNQNRLDADISTRESEAQAASRAVTNQAEHDATQAAIAALNDPSATEIADQVWDETLADHLGVGSTGAALGNADAPTLNEIVDGVWNEALASHTIVGSAAVELKGKTEPGDQMDLVANALDANALDISAVAEIADGVWDENMSGHTLAGSAGQQQNRLDATISSRATPGAAMDLVTNAVDADAIADSGKQEIADQVWDELLAGHGIVGSAGEAQARVDATVSSRAIPGSQMALTPGERSATVDAIWDEPISGHLGVGSTGKALDDAKATADPDAVGTAVWSKVAATGGAGTMGELQRRLDANVSSRAAPGAAMDLVANAVDAAALATDAVNEIRNSILSDATPFQGARIDAAISSRSQPGDAMDLVTDAVDSNALATSAVNEIVDQVWEEQIGDHSGTAGSTAEQLAAAGGGATPATIAAAVWDEDITLHTAVDSAGEAQNHLDADVSSRSSHSAADVDTQLTGSHGAGSWNPATGFATPADVTGAHATTDAAIAALNDVSANEVRDAILADSTPFNGASVAAILADTAAIDGRLPPDPADESSQNTKHATTQAAVAAVASAVAAVPDNVWDEPLSGHPTLGSAGKALADAAAGGDPASIANAVWEESQAAHTTAGTMGESQELAANTGTQAAKIDSVATLDPSAATPGSLLDRLCNKNVSQTYDQETDSLEGIRDRVG